MEDVIEAHYYSANHKEQLMQDSVCGCFYCGNIFNPSEITEWLKDISGTAICPYCGIDSVIGESSGFPLQKNSLNECVRVGSEN